MRALNSSCRHCCLYVSCCCCCFFVSYLLPHAHKVVVVGCVICNTYQLIISAMCSVLRVVLRVHFFLDDLRFRIDGHCTFRSVFKCITFAQSTRAYPCIVRVASRSSQPNGNHSVTVAVAECVCMFHLTAWPHKVRFGVRATCIYEYERQLRRGHSIKNNIIISLILHKNKENRERPSCLLDAFDEGQKEIISALHLSGAQCINTPSHIHTHIETLEPVRALMHAQTQTEERRTPRNAFIRFVQLVFDIVCLRGIA